MTPVLNGGFYVQSTADAQNSLVVDDDFVVPCQFVSNTAIALIWTFCVDFFHFFCYFLVPLHSLTALPSHPVVVATTGDVENFTGYINGIAAGLVAMANGTVEMYISYLR